MIGYLGAAAPNASEFATEMPDSGITRYSLVRFAVYVGIPAAIVYAVFLRKKPMTPNRRRRRRR